MNTVVLASYDYGDLNSLTLRNKTLDIISTILTILFTVEGLCKILAHGFILHKRAYLRNGWNWLDFIVIVAGWVVLIPGVPQFKGLRTLRILRPLRLINQAESLKKQVDSLIKALTQLVNLFLFMMCVYLIFAILGIMIFQGRFY